MTNNNGRKKTASSRERFGFRKGARVTPRPFASVERVNQIATDIKSGRTLDRIVHGFTA